MEKRYRKAVKEDAEYADMMYYYLIECGADKAEGMSDDEFRNRQLSPTLPDSPTHDKITPIIPAKWNGLRWST